MSSSTHFCFQFPLSFDDWTRSKCLNLHVQKIWYRPQSSRSSIRWFRHIVIYKQSIRTTTILEIYTDDCSSDSECCRNDRDHNNSRNPGGCTVIIWAHVRGTSTDMILAAKHVLIRSTVPTESTRLSIACYSAHTGLKSSVTTGRRTILTVRIVLTFVVTIAHL